MKAPRGPELTRPVKIHSREIGTIRVTVLRDSLVDFPLGLMTGASTQEFEEIHQLRRGGAPRITINAFLVESGRSKILIDTGVGGAARDSTGLLTHGLAGLGLAPSDITHVLFTHLHADHAGGAVTGDGESVFAHAHHLVHYAERDYWFGDELPAHGEAVHAQYLFTRTLLPMLSRFEWIQEGQVLPGIDLVHLPGHTPGHSGYRISSGGDSLFIWGDIVHQPAFQFFEPAWGVAFDSAPGEAIETRRRVLDEARASGELVAGMHTDFPAFGTVRVADRQGYEFVPVSDENAGANQ